VQRWQIVIPEEGYDESDYDYDYKQYWAAIGVGGGAGGKVLQPLCLPKCAGEVQRVDARFLACEAEQPSQVEEELPLDGLPALPETEEESIDDAAPEEGSRLLQLKNYKAFPVPSYGDVQVQFEAEAKPTTVQLIDATGKVIYTEQLNNFDGEYNKELNLREAASGNIILSIRQGDKTVAKTLLLLNRA
jgi:hypothetical protein